VAVASIITCCIGDDSADSAISVTDRGGQCSLHNIVYMYIHSSEEYTYYTTNIALKLSAENLSTKFYNKLNHKNTKKNKNNFIITKIPRERLYIHFRFIIKIEIMTTKNIWAQVINLQ